MRMQVAPTLVGGESLAWEAKVTLASAGVSEWVYVPDSVAGLSVTAEGNSGATATVQTTTDRIPDVEAGTETAVAWDLGAVTTPAQDACSPVTAIRLKQVGSGNTKMTVRAQ